MFPRQTNNTDTFDAGAVLSVMFKPNPEPASGDGGLWSVKSDWDILNIRAGYPRMTSS